MWVTIILCAAANAPVAKLKRLVMDVRESMESHREDELLAVGAADSFLSGLRSNIEKEITALQTTQDRLQETMQGFQAEMTKARRAAKESSDSAAGSDRIASNYAKNSDQMSEKFRSVKLSVQALLAVLENGAVTSDGTLITPEEPDAHGQPKKVFRALHQLLESRASVRKEFPGLAVRFENPANKVSAEIVKDAIRALQMISLEVKASEDLALDQTDVQRVLYESTTSQSQQDFANASGEEADAKRGRQEVVFSQSVTATVLQRDEDFYQALKQHLLTRNKLSLASEGIHKDEMGAFQNLVRLLEHPQQKALEGQERVVKSHSPPSFLQTSPSLAALQAQITTAVKKKTNTHELLEKLTAALHLGVDTQKHLNQVQDLAATLHDVVMALDDQEDRTAEAKRLCNEEIHKANAQVKAIQSGIHLMQLAQNHTQRAIASAKNNLNGLEDKGKALDASLKNFSHLHDKLKEVLAAHWQDEKTITMALEKAVGVSKGLPSALADAAIYLEQVLRNVKRQEDNDRSYLDSESAFLLVFQQYVRDYQVLLWNRQKHYRDSLAQLELYHEDAFGNQAWNNRALQNANVLQQNAQELCATLVAFEAHEAQKRAAIKQDLTALLPTLA